MSQRRRRGRCWAHGTNKLSHESAPGRSLANPSDPSFGQAPHLRSHRLEKPFPRARRFTPRKLAQPLRQTPNNECLAVSWPPVTCHGPLPRRRVVVALRRFRAKNASGQFVCTPGVISAPSPAPCTLFFFLTPTAVAGLLAPDTAGSAFPPCGLHRRLGAPPAGNPPDNLTYVPRNDHCARPSRVTKTSPMRPVPWTLA